MTQNNISAELERMLTGLGEFPWGQQHRRLMEMPLPLHTMKPTLNRPYRHGDGDVQVPTWEATEMHCEDTPRTRSRPNATVRDGKREVAAVRLSLLGRSGARQRRGKAERLRATLRLP